jgi:hypothetical protein
MRGESGTAEKAGAKALTHFADFTARLKPCPCYKTSFDDFFGKLLWGFGWSLALVPSIETLG